MMAEEKKSVELEMNLEIYDCHSSLLWTASLRHPAGQMAVHQSA
jgi:hypothetical protein